MQCQAFGKTGVGGFKFLPLDGDPSPFLQRELGDCLGLNIGVMTKPKIGVLAV